MTSPYDPPHFDDAADAGQALAPIERSAWRRSRLARRTAAFAVDWVLLWGLAMIIGAAFRDLWMYFGWSAPFFGLGIGVAFFGVISSHVSRGQTFGMRWLKLRVVDARGNAPSLPRAFLRSGILVSPIALNHMVFPGYHPPAIAALGVVLFGVGPAVFLLPLLSRTTGAFGLHDLVSGTRVVGADDPADSLAPPPRNLLAIAAGWCGLVLLASLIMDSRGSSPLVDRLEAIRVQADVQSVMFNENHTSLFTLAGREEIDSIQITAWSTRSPAFFSKTARVLAQNGCALLPRMPTARSVQISVNYGWTLGIAQSFDTTTWQGPSPCGGAAHDEAATPDASAGSAEAAAPNEAAAPDHS